MFVQGLAHSRTDLCGTPLCGGVQTNQNKLMGKKHFFFSFGGEVRVKILQNEK